MAPSAIFTAIVGIGGLGFILYKVRHLDRYRREEQAARDFFDVNHHWPDETLEDAIAEREMLLRTMPYAVPIVQQPDAEGRV
jgi:hypothetical protein